MHVVKCETISCAVSGWHFHFDEQEEDATGLVSAELSIMWGLKVQGKPS